MIKELIYDNDSVFVHVDEISLKTTKAFTHGSIRFNVATRTVTFGKLPAVALPSDLVINDGAVLKFQLVGPDGKLRKQVRGGVLKGNDKQPEILSIAGMAQTARRFAAEDGWSNAIYKYRAFFTHPGAKTTGAIPEWLTASIDRQRAYWNRLAWLCRDARRKCSPVPTEEIIAFVQGTILPAIDAFNLGLDRAHGKLKMKHPPKLKAEAPGLDGIWSFVGTLRKRIEDKKPLPEGLLDLVIAFAEQYKGDYTPFNEFLSDFTATAEKEARELGLRRYEIRPVAITFKAALDRRRTTKAPWSEGWPRLRFADSPRADNWGLHYYLNKAGVGTELLETGSGVSGLFFGSPLAPAGTGHPDLKGGAAKRKLREAEIDIPGPNRERQIFRFAVLQHRPLPTDSHIKEWKLLFQDGALWLCLVVELQRPVPVHQPFAAGLDIGWRCTEEGLRFGTLYEPVSKTIRELTIDFGLSPKDPKDRVPFRIDLGPKRWEKRNLARLFPDLKPGDPIPNFMESRSVLQARRDYLKDTAKILLRKDLGDAAPAWLEKAGRRGLLKIEEEMKDNEQVQAVLGPWHARDTQLGELISMYSAASTRRMEYGQAQVAHDVCRYLQQKGIMRLIVETSFLAKLAQSQKNEDPISLKRSQKYRQLAAVGKFLALLKNTAAKYGIAVETHEAINTTRVCQHCNHLNPGTEKETYQCEACDRLIKQDHNAAVNLSRFSADPELAEMAVHGGQ